MSRRLKSRMSRHYVNRTPQQPNSPLMTIIDEALFMTATRFLADVDITELRSSMQSRGYAVLPNLLNGDLLAQLKEECSSLLNIHGVERNFLMAQTSNTPRRMLNVKRNDIKMHGQIIPKMYESPAIRRLFELIIQDSLITCPYAPEEYIINGLFKSADTHGWHWDDYKYGVVFAIETPERGCGGLVQCVPNTTWERNKTGVEDAMCSGPCYTFRLAPGDAYILKTDTGMHRVSPIESGTHRVVVNMVWSTPSEVNTVASHDTMEAIFS